MDETTVSRETTTGLAKIGYYLENDITSGWLYEVSTTEAVTRRVEMLLNDKCVRKISIQKDYGV
jgi:hypothetical protein